MQECTAILARFDDFSNLWFIVALLVIAAARAFGEKLKDKAEEQPYKKSPSVTPKPPGQARPPRPAPPAQRRPRPPVPAGRGPVIVIAPEESPQPQLSQPAAPPRARPASPRPARAQARPPTIAAEPSKRTQAGFKPLDHKNSKPAQPSTRQRFRVSRKTMRRAVILSEILKPPLALRENEAYNELG